MKISCLQSMSIVPYIYTQAHLISVHSKHTPLMSAQDNYGIKASIEHTKVAAWWKGHSTDTL